MLGSFNNWNIIKLLHKSTAGEDFEEIYQVVLEGIRNNMSPLVQYGKNSSVETTYSTTIGYYVITFVSESYTLQEDTTCDGKILHMAN